MQFSQTLSNYQKGISQEIEKFFDGKISQAKAPFEKEVLGWLKEYSLRPAKRIRAILVNYGYFLAGGSNKKGILTTSIFIELIHNYLLIHDDIIDKDELRRGKKALHRLCGENLAICAGDLVNALGYEILTDSPFPVGYRLKALEKLNQTLYSTGYGQMFELNLRNKKKFTDQDVLEIYTRKTAFYTVVTPLQVGALLGGADEKFLKKIERFALPLGIAFQIRDDLKDGDIENIFGFQKEKYRKMQQRLIVKSQENIKQEKIFPKKEKEFLLNLADYCKTK